MEEEEGWFGWGPRYIYLGGGRKRERDVRYRCRDEEEEETMVGRLLAVEGGEGVTGLGGRSGAIDAHDDAGTLAGANL